MSLPDVRYNMNDSPENEEGKYITLTSTEFSCLVITEKRNDEEQLTINLCNLYLSCHYEPQNMFPELFSYCCHLATILHTPCGCRST